ncbi:hypothetical protein NDI39_22810 [Microcoleus sp. ZQ-A2]|nr:hypothetical protein [Microcoleus sp. FACHB-1]
MKLLIGLIAAITLLTLSSLNWRRSVKAVLVILVLEGALRKWVLPQASDMMYFLKDVILLGAYIKYYVLSTSERKYPLKGQVINSLIFLVAGWGLFQAFNSSLGSPIVGLLGLRSYIFYIPLMWMAPNLFQSEEELYQYLRSYLLLTIPVCLLGIAQFYSPASSPINTYAPGVIKNVATFGNENSVRVTGTFSFISGFSLYLIVCFGLLLPLILRKQSWKWKWIFISELLLVSVNLLMTGSRTSGISAGLFLLGYLIVLGLKLPARTLNLLRKFFVPAIIVAIAAFIWFRPALEAYWYRSTKTHDVSYRVVSSFVEPFEFMKYKQLDGYGTGATHQGSAMLRRVLNLPPGEVISVYHEAEMGRIALELGPVGFLFWYGLRVSLAMALLRNFWKLKRPFLRQLSLAASLIQAIQITGLLVFHHTFLVHYWFLSGFIFLLPRLEQLENWQTEQQMLQEHVLSSYFSNSSYR